MAIVIERKRRVGRPISDPFHKLRKHGVAHTYVKNIPLSDWKKFKKLVEARGETTRFAIIRFVQGYR